MCLLSVAYDRSLEAAPEAVNFAENEMPMGEEGNSHGEVAVAEGLLLAVSHFIVFAFPCLMVQV